MLHEYNKTNDDSECDHTLRLIRRKTLKDGILALHYSVSLIHRIQLIRQ